MSAEKYSFTSEPALRLLSIRVTGFWTDADMQDYLVNLRSTVAAMGPDGGCSRIFVDMSDYPIQTGEIAQAHADALRYAKEKLGVRAALVMGSTLSKLQASRVASHAGHAFFSREADARAWLISQ